MWFHNVLAGACALAMLSCSGDDSDVDRLPDENGDPAAKADSQEPAAHRHRRRSSTASAQQSAGSVVTRVTSDGERIQVIVPEPAPTNEVPAGSACGVVDANGVLLSCAPGTYCVSPGEGLAGRCEVAPRAPRTDG